MAKILEMSANVIIDISSLLGKERPKESKECENKKEEEENK